MLDHDIYDSKLVLLSEDAVKLIDAGQAISVCNPALSANDALQTLLCSFWRGVLPVYELKTPPDCTEHESGLTLCDGRITAERVRVYWTRERMLRFLRRDKNAFPPVETTYIAFAYLRYEEYLPSVEPIGHLRADASQLATLCELHGWISPNAWLSVRKLLPGGEDVVIGQYDRCTASADQQHNLKSSKTNEILAFEELVPWTEEWVARCHRDKIHPGRERHMSDATAQFPGRKIRYKIARDALEHVVPASIRVRGRPRKM